MLKNAFRLREFILLLKVILTFYQKVCVRKPGHCKWIVFVTSEDSQNMEGKFHSFSFLLERAECVGMQCTGTIFRDSFLLSTATYLTRGFVSKESNVKEIKIFRVKIINSYVLCFLCGWIADYAKMQLSDISYAWPPTRPPAHPPAWLILKFLHVFSRGFHIL
jgi:hypothetical protein